MPELEFSDQLHAEKYRTPGETFREAMNRNANALADDDQHFRALQDIYTNQRFLNAGRIQAGAGSPRHVTMLNCFVMPTIEDSFVDGENSIMGVASKAAQTMRMGGGVGYDFSTLRPSGALIKTLGSRSSGPIQFMHIYDAVCRATSSAGNRRGAEMGVLRCDHPDILKFIHAKRNQDSLTGFNISVALTDEFMRAVQTGSDFQLRWGGQDYEVVSAQMLWDEIMRSTWDYAEPGALFIDTINRMNNLYYTEQIAATNPCAEQPLPPNGSCLLASSNLTKYVIRPTDVPHDSRGWASYKIFDTETMIKDILWGSWAMDNVVDRSLYPLPEQAEEARMKRRIGIGVTGLANAIEALGHKYGSEGFLEMTDSIMNKVKLAAYAASVQRARRKGAFPLFDRDKYLAGEHIRTLPGNLRDDIAEYGIRNSHNTSVAPTGTISFAADNISSGCEPPYALTADRIVNREGGQEVVEVQDYAYRMWGIKSKTAMECTTDEHLAVLATVQKHVDSAVSKTINVDPDTPWEKFKDVYMTAWQSGCKGVTTFNPKGKRVGIMKAKDSEEAPEACMILEDGTKSCDF